MLIKMCVSLSCSYSRALVSELTFFLSLSLSLLFHLAAFRNIPPQSACRLPTAADVSDSLPRRAVSKWAGDDSYDA